MLKFQVESLDGIDEAHQPLYKEAEKGGFVLQVDGAVSQTEVQGFKQKAVDAAEEARRRRATVERVTAKLGLEGADGLDEKLDALIAGQGKGKPDEEHQAVIDQLKAKAAERETELQGKYTGVLKRGAQAEFKAALMAQGFGEPVAKMIAASNMGRITFDENGNMRIVQENGNPLAGSGDDGFANVGDLSKELAAAMPDLLVDKGKGGGGKPPASGNADNPSKSGSLIGDRPSRLQAIRSMKPKDL